MKESDRDWWQEKTDEASGFHQSSAFDTRPLMRAAPKRRRAKPRRPWFMKPIVLMAIALAAVALVVWFVR